MWTVYLATGAACVAIAALLAVWSLQRRYARLAAELGSLSHVAAQQRSTASSLVELAEVRDAIDKGNHLLRRIQMRENMRGKANGAEAPPPSDTASLKAYLRQKAGLTAGKPAPHRE